MPAEFTWLEMQILDYLARHRRPVAMIWLRQNLAPGNEEATVVQTLALKEAGFVRMWNQPDLMVEITDEGLRAHAGVAATSDC